MFTKESNLFLMILLLISLGLIVVLLSGFATPLVLGAILATISYTPYKRLAEKLKGRKSLASLIVVIIIVLIIILPFFGVMTLLANEAFDLIRSIRIELGSDSPFATVTETLSKYLNIDARVFLENQILPNVNRLGTFISSQISQIISASGRLAIGFFLLVMTIFYLLRDGEQFATFLKRLSPLQKKDDALLFDIFRQTGKAVFVGNIISAIAQGLLGGLGFVIFGLPSPIFWGTVIAFISLIPLLGPYVISVPATILIFLTGKPFIALGFLLYNTLIVSTADNVIKPKLIGDKIKVHPLFILLAILGGLKMFGIIGIVYGPLVAAIFMSLVHTFEKNAERKKQQQLTEAKS
ncbi:MAG: hypothetical protein COU08_01190 [Candidatus Harrisonbacteria bacterium CG10_big_fil_rev_8_21_14_0_10_42_17]|uniref:AI-2E family transporter n=1 Tax=Candidatus Harrisonbacteria bacterium CG10_big_fil_rev_8_21_14_0_10_42_17 TaxID=1974584 RepID=A0A2M6WIK8_9BACT|nr:MAG: hypothetical protein COU08_01190 [Candidatus Harrisonbacteria bacterium CG10_big_fil_rev_8_21_14_0_10_42_17]